MRVNIQKELDETNDSSYQTNRVHAGWCLSGDGGGCMSARAIMRVIVIFGGYAC